MHNRSAAFPEPGLELRTAPSTNARVVSLIGVDCFRLKTGDGGDLYLTRFGLPFGEQLTPENWNAPGWFDVRRARLPGTSATLHAIHDLEQFGFRMLDIKPEHIVLRIRRAGSRLRRRTGNPAYALVDYELRQRFREPD